MILQPRPIFRLIGEANETEVTLNQSRLKALVNSGSQISTMTETLAKLMGLKVKSLKNILEIEGTGGIQVKYKGYIEAVLGVLQIRNFEEPCLFVVVSDSEYGKTVPIQIGMLHIDMVLGAATKEELSLMGKAWERGTLFRETVNGRGQFNLDEVNGVVKTVEKVKILPGETKRVSGMAQFKGTSQRFNLVTEPLQENQQVNESSWVVIPGYAESKSGSSRVGVAVWNVSKAVVIIAKGQQLARVTTANQVPNMLAPKYIEGNGEPKKSEGAIQERIKKLREKLDLNGAQSWTKDQKSRIQET